MAGSNTTASSGKKEKTPPDNPVSTTTPKKKRKISQKKTCGVLDYIRNAVPRSTLLRLYSSSSRGQYACRAVLQQLPAISRQIIARLHCAGGIFPSQSVCNVWLSTNSSNHNELLHELHTWAIIEENWSIDEKATNSETITLTEPFRIGLSETLSCFESSPWTPIEPSHLRTMEEQATLAAGDIDVVSTITADLVSSSVTKKKSSPQKPPKSVGVSPEDLERFVQKQWDAVLHFLVGSVGYADEPPPAMVHFLLQTGLMQSDPEFHAKKKKSVTSDVADEEENDDEAPLVITEAGYDFMLQDNAQQVWHFVAQYLRSVEEHEETGDEALNEALLLLICLSFSEVGSAYLASSSTLSRHARAMLKDLSHFGLIFIRKIGKSTIFYPTHIATQLIGGTSPGNSSSAIWSLSNKALETALADPRPHDSSHLAIIVQTNFQLCAYTTSELHVSMLGLFCDVSTIRRLPNVVFLQITRDSVKSAFALGIQAKQILRFLEKHTHPHLRKPDIMEPIPSNIVDQIWLWDRELSRVRFTKVYSHEVQMGNDEYRAVLLHAREIGALRYHADSRQQLLLDYGHVHTMQAFVRQWRAQAVSRV